MSNSLAIAAVTATLRNLIFEGVNALVAGTDVTAKPLDKARLPGAGNQVNLFLYHAEVDGALRNMDPPGNVKPGETGFPPFPLALSYLITAYGENDEEVKGHELLGRAVSVLHDHPVLGADEIQAALPGNDLYQQVDRVRVTWQPMSLEETSKLWTALQTQYRTSVAFQASVVLIDSRLPARSALPVLTRGPEDQGPVAQADTTPPFPSLDGIRLPKGEGSALLGDELTLVGHRLAGVSVRVLFSNRHLPDPIVVPPPPVVSATDTEVRVILLDDPTQVPAGLYAVVAAITESAGKDERTTNGVPLGVAPKITSSMPMVVNIDPSNGTATINLDCSPQVLPAQDVFLLLGDLQVPSAPHPAQTGSLTFVVTDAKPGDYLVRLRVDGVDSLLVDNSGPLPVFDQNQKVQIQ